MFQNIAKDFDENQESYEDVELNRKEKIKEVLKKCFNKQMILLYIISVSVVKYTFSSSDFPILNVILSDVQLMIRQAGFFFVDLAFIVY